MPTVKKTLLAIVLAPLSVLSVSTSAQTLEKITIASAVHLGYRSNSVPFSYADKAGNPQGYAVDICKSLSSALSRELKIPQLKTVWIPVGPNERNTALADGLIDIDCADSTLTVQSQKTVAFSVPLFISATHMVVNRKPVSNDIGELAGKTVVTTSQSGNEAMLRYVLSQTGVKAEPIVVRTPKKALELLQTGKAQALFADDATLFGIKLDGQDIVNLTVLPKTYSIRPKALTFRRDDEKMRVFMLRHMKELISSGTLPKMYEQWFTTVLPGSSTNLGVPLNYLLRETWKLPTDTFVDFSYGHLPD